MLSRPHPCLGWLHVTPNDTRRLLDRLLKDRDAALEADPIHSGMPQAFIDWTWQTWLPANLHRYEKQVKAHLAYLDSKIGTLNSELERRVGGVLDDRDAAADLRDRLQRQLEAREVVSWPIFWNTSHMCPCWMVLTIGMPQQRGNTISS